MLPDTERTTGAAGRRGGSATSVTLIVTDALAVAPLPSRAVTVTERDGFDS